MRFLRASLILPILAVAAERPFDDYARGGNLEFVAHAHRALVAASNPGENAFWSPASLQAALAALGEGSRTVSAKEIAGLLRLPAPTGQGNDFALMHAFNRATAEHLGSAITTSAGPDSPELVFAYRAAGHLWVQEDFAVKDAFVATLQGAYGPAMLRKADFRRRAEGVRSEANQLIEQETEGLLKEALPKGFFDEETRVAFAHVVHLRADWSQPFNASETRPAPFRGLDGETRYVPTMTDPRRRLRYAAFEADGRAFSTPKQVPYGNDDGDPRHYPGVGGCQVVTIPYHGYRASMVVVLPTGGGTLAALEARLTAPRLEAMVRSGEEYSCLVRWPRFKAKADWNLAVVLPKLGLTSVFDPGRADLSGIVAPPPPLYVSGFLQKGELEVNERGTIAAVVTAYAIAASAGRPDLTKTRPFVPQFVADRPFLYLIVDDLTGQVLFMGRVLRP